jgi:hypothetical protein
MAESSKPDLPALDFQRLWFSTLKKEWRSLAVIPAHPGKSVAPIAKALARVGAAQRDGIKLISGESADLTAASRVTIEMCQHVAEGGLCIVVLDSLVQNPAAIPVALAADAALLCVQLEAADIDSGRRTVELLGEGKLVGAVSVESRH